MTTQYRTGTAPPDEGWDTRLAEQTSKRFGQIVQRAGGTPAAEQLALTTLLDSALAEERSDAELGLVARTVLGEIAVRDRDRLAVLQGRLDTALVENQEERSRRND